MEEPNQSAGINRDNNAAESAGTDQINAASSGSATESARVRVFDETQVGEIGEAGAGLKKKKPIKKWPFILIAAVVAVAGAAALLAGPVIKRVSPEAYLAGAAARTFSGSGPSLANQAMTVRKIFAGNWSQSLTLGIDKLDAAGLGIDDNTLAMLSIGKLSVSAARDTGAREASLGLAARLGETDVLSADMYLSDAQFALKVPQLLGAYIYADPRSLVTEWNGSVLATMLPLDGVTDEEIAGPYGQVLDALFKVPEARTAAPPDVMKALAGASYSYGGADQGLDVFKVTLKRDAVNAYIAEAAGGYLASLDSLLGYLGASGSAKSSLGVNGDAPLTLRVKGGLIISVGFEADAAVSLNGNSQDMHISGTAEFNGEQKKTDQIGLDMDITARDFAAGLSMTRENRSSDANVIDRTVSGTINLSYPSGANQAVTVPFDMALYWDTAAAGGDNFSVSLDMSADNGSGGGANDVSLSVGGGLVFGTDSFEANMKDISFSVAPTGGTPESIELNADYSASVLTGPLSDFRQADSKAIGDIGLDEILEIGANLTNDTFLGGLLNGTNGTEQQ
ncbi:MAG: hypothetical protein FWC55_00205 [Firmicutes bacterium]|nr:hypothetical protein [Bacillota bacterium]